jgi:hypothetical protein
MKFIIFCSLLQFVSTLTCTSGNSSSHIISVRPGDSVLMYCEVISTLLPRINVSSNVNLTFLNYSMVKFNNGSTRFIQPIQYQAPSNDLDAYKQNGRKIKCQVEQEVCYMQLNVQFEPFIDSNVALIQTLNENAAGVVECPIRAPSFPPYKYVLVWYGPDERASLIQNYTLTSYYYNLERAVSHNKTYKCVLYKRDELMLESSVVVLLNKPERKSSQPKSVFVESTSIFFGICLFIVALWVGQERVQRILRVAQEGILDRGAAAAAAVLLPSPPPPPPPPTSLPLSALPSSISTQYKTANTSFKSDTTLKASSSTMTNLTLM